MQIQNRFSEEISCVYLRLLKNLIYQALLANNQSPTPGSKQGVKNDELSKSVTMTVLSH